MLYPLSYEGGEGEAIEMGAASAGRLGNGTETARVAPVELVEGRCGCCVGGQPDDEVLLVAVGQLQHFRRQAQRTDRGVGELGERRALRRFRVTSPPSLERRSGGGGELGDETVECRIGARYPGAQECRLLIGERLPLGNR